MPSYEIYGSESDLQLVEADLKQKFMQNEKIRASSKYKLLGKMLAQINIHFDLVFKYFVKDGFIELYIPPATTFYKDELYDNNVKPIAFLGTTIKVYKIDENKNKVLISESKSTA